MDTNSEEWKAGYAAAIVFLYDIFESRSNALYRRGIRRKDLRLILAVIDAMLVSRDRIAEVGPRNLDLVLHKSGTVEFIERNR